MDARTYLMQLLAQERDKASPWLRAISTCYADGELAALASLIESREPMADDDRTALVEFFRSKRRSGGQRLSERSPALTWLAVADLVGRELVNAGVDRGFAIVAVAAALHDPAEGEEAMASKLANAMAGHRPDIKRERPHITALLGATALRELVALVRAASKNPEAATPVRLSRHSALMRAQPDHAKADNQD